MPGDFCPVYESVNLLQEKWTLHIVRSLLGGDKGFNELGRDIGGCNPTTLTQRLERLEATGVVSKTVCSTTPPRTRYALTEAGRALQEVIEAISTWGERYLDVHEARGAPKKDVPKKESQRALQPAAVTRAS